MTDRDEFEKASPQAEEHVRRALENAALLLDDVVEGIGEGKTADGAPSIVIMVSSRTPDVEARIPESIEGIPVEIIESGPFAAGG